MPGFRSASWRIMLCCLSALVISSCEDSKKRDEKPKPKNPKKGKVTKSTKARVLDKPVPGISKAIEEFTGAHTRIVWTEHGRLKGADTFAISNELVLKGIDTRDGKSERMIQNRMDNYSRPLLSSDGEVILFTDKDVVRKGGKKHYDPDIYRTDWSGSKPVRIGEGYAVDCWKDPVTGVEWVYAARHFTPASTLSMEAAELVRFQLEDPSKVEVVYDESRISPDNIQISRDGSRASGLFPWPDAGVFVRDESGRYHGKKLQTGCWPSLAPDDSGVSWVFDGGHRAATFFAPDGRKPWTVWLNDSPASGGYEMYHPRWSNHPRFIAITGPYLPVKNASGNVINKGGASANVHLGRFSETLDKVEAWLQITDDKLSESFPDVWIHGAENASLTAFAKTSQAVDSAFDWPAVSDHLVFVWHDRSSLNQFKSSDGRLRTSPPLRPHGTARHGRLEEMLVDDGHFEIDAEDAADVVGAFSSGGDVTFEIVLLPGGTAANGVATRAIFSAPGLTVAQDSSGHLLVSRGSTTLRSATALPMTAFHLVVARKGAEFQAAVNGAPVTLESANVAPSTTATDQVVFGGGWHGGMLGIAIYGRALQPEEIAQHSSIQTAALSKLPPPPSQVRVKARLAEVSSMPTAEGIAPYTGALVVYLYEVEEVLSGKLDDKRILVKHWAMLDQQPLAGFPKEVGKTYELTLEREDDHPHLKGERAMDDTAAFDLTSWFDIEPPRKL